MFARQADKDIHKLTILLFDPDRMKNVKDTDILSNIELLPLGLGFKRKSPSRAL